MGEGRLGNCGEKTARSEAARFSVCVLKTRGEHNKNDAFKMINLALQDSID